LEDFAFASQFVRFGVSIEKGRAANKSPHPTFGYFLSTSQQEVSAGIIQNSAVGNFSPKTEGTKTNAAGWMSLFSDVFSIPVHFEFFASSITVNILPSLSAC
jgi:hypothetical protein